ncbi:MAG TPA: complex I NDUFA9 subunit family protein, partial [Sphingomonas sp.]|jgi:NADH dehydrogenase
VPVLRAGVKFQPVFVGDVANAVVAALNPAHPIGRTLDLGGPDIITMGALLRWIADAIGRRPAFVDLPDFAGSAIARAGFLPGAPISWDQWLMLQSDNVAAEDGLAALGVSATPLGAVAPGFLVRFRRQGRFSGRADTLA